MQKRLVWGVAAAAALALLVGVSVSSVAAEGSVTEPQAAAYGAASAQADTDLTLADMLTYAMQDEYLAEAEYNLIMEHWGTQRPFSNIMVSEQAHQSWLTDLFTKYEVALPDKAEVTAHAVLPASLEEAFATGVEAEIENIAMYERFLEQELPEDVRAVFERLRNASEHHKQAFERGLLQDGAQPGGEPKGKGHKGGDEQGAEHKGNGPMGNGPKSKGPMGKGHQGERHQGGGQHGGGHQGGEHECDGHGDGAQQGLSQQGGAQQMGPRNRGR